MPCEEQISLKNKEETSNNKKLSCPNCKKDKIRKKGFRQTKERGKQQRYICNSCNYSFTQNNGFWRMKKPEKRIVQAIDTYYEDYL